MKASLRVVVAEMRVGRKFVPSISRSSDDSRDSAYLLRTFQRAEFCSRNSEFASDESSCILHLADFKELLLVNTRNSNRHSQFYLSSYISKSFFLVKNSQIWHNVPANICYSTGSSMPEESSTTEVHSLLLHHDMSSRTSICRNKLDTRASTAPSQIKSQLHHHSQRRASTRSRRSYANRFPSPSRRHSIYVQYPLRATPLPMFPGSTQDSRRGPRAEAHPD